MFRDLLLGKRQAKTPAPVQTNNDPSDPDDYGIWPMVAVVALIVTILMGLFVFVGSLPAIHEYQKNRASNESVRP